jgi:ABC-type Fe3+ transport system substrate-binding protein
MKLKVLAMLAAFLAVLDGAATTALGQGDGSLSRLIEAARREKQLDLTITSSQGDKGGRELTEAFKKRFGLSLTVNADLSGQESQKFNQAVAEAKAGIAPTFDVMQGEPPVVLDLIQAGGIDPIPNWEALLAQVAPEAFKVKEKVSPVGVAGYGFVWANRVTALLYNPKAISQPDLPKTWKEIGNAKHRGAFSIPPWTTITLMGLLKYNKDEWLEIVQSWGKLKPQVLHYAAAVERMMIGELKFLETNTHYYFNHKAKDANAPIEMNFFADLTPTREVTYVVRKGARNPNAAKLFALWSTSEEANRIFERHSVIENLALGTGPVTRKTLEKLKQNNIKPASWFENQQTLDKFLWLGTEEGRKYSQAIARAQREGK